MSEGRIFSAGGWGGSVSSKALRPECTRCGGDSSKRLVWLQLNGDGRRVGNEVREVEVRVCRRAQW